MILEFGIISILNIYPIYLKLSFEFSMRWKLYFDFLFSVRVWMAYQLQVWSNPMELNLEPLSIFSVIFQLATATPKISKVFMKEESSDLTRTQVIEFYRSNMSSNFQDKPDN